MQFELEGEKIVGRDFLTSPCRLRHENRSFSSWDHSAFLMTKSIFPYLN